MEETNIEPKTVLLLLQNGQFEGQTEEEVVRKIRSNLPLILNKTIEENYNVEGIYPVMYTSQVDNADNATLEYGENMKNLMKAVSGLIGSEQTRDRHQLLESLLDMKAAQQSDIIRRLTVKPTAEDINQLTTIITKKLCGNIGHPWLLTLNDDVIVPVSSMEMEKNQKNDPETLDSCAVLAPVEVFSSIQQLDKDKNIISAKHQIPRGGAGNVLIPYLNNLLANSNSVTSVEEINVRMLEKPEFYSQFAPFPESFSQQLISWLSSYEGIISYCNTVGEKYALRRAIVSSKLKFNKNKIRPPYFEPFTGNAAAQLEARERKTREVNSFNLAAQSLGGMLKEKNQSIPINGDGLAQLNMLPEHIFLSKSVTHHLHGRDHTNTALGIEKLAHPHAPPPPGMVHEHPINERVKEEDIEEDIINHNSYYKQQGAADHYTQAIQNVEDIENVGMLTKYGYNGLVRGSVYMAMQYFINGCHIFINAQDSSGNPYLGGLSYKGIGTIPAENRMQFLWDFICKPFWDFALSFPEKHENNPFMLMSDPHRSVYYWLKYFSTDEKDHANIFSQNLIEFALAFSGHVDDNEDDLEEGMGGWNYYLEKNGKFVLPDSQNALGEEGGHSGVDRLKTDAEMSRASEPKNLWGQRNHRRTDFTHRIPPSKNSSNKSSRSLQNKYNTRRYYLGEVESVDNMLGNHHLNDAEHAAEKNDQQFGAPSPVISGEKIYKALNYKPRVNGLVNVPKRSDASTVPSLYLFFIALGFGKCVENSLHAKKDIKESEERKKIAQAQYEKVRDRFNVEFTTGNQIEVEPSFNGSVQMKAYKRFINNNSDKLLEPHKLPTTLTDPDSYIYVTHPETNGLFSYITSLNSQSENSKSLVEITDNSVHELFLRTFNKDNSGISFGCSYGLKKYIEQAVQLDTNNSKFIDSYIINAITLNGQKDKYREIFKTARTFLSANEILTSGFNKRTLYYTSTKNIMEGPIERNNTSLRSSAVTLIGCMLSSLIGSLVLSHNYQRDITNINPEILSLISQLSFLVVAKILLVAEKQAIKYYTEYQVFYNDATKLGELGSKGRYGEREKVEENINELLNNIKLALTRQYAVPESITRSMTDLFETIDERIIDFERIKNYSVEDFVEFPAEPAHPSRHDNQKQAQKNYNTGLFISKESNKLFMRSTTPEFWGENKLTAYVPPDLRVHQPPAPGGGPGGGPGPGPGVIPDDLDYPYTNVIRPALMVDILSDYQIGKPIIKHMLDIWEAVLSANIPDVDIAQYLHVIVSSGEIVLGNKFNAMQDIDVDDFTEAESVETEKRRGIIQSHSTENIIIKDLWQNREAFNIKKLRLLATSFQKYILYNNFQIHRNKGYYKGFLTGAKINYKNDNYKPHVKLHHEILIMMTQIARDSVGDINISFNNITQKFQNIKFETIDTPLLYYSVTSCPPYVYNDYGRDVLSEVHKNGWLFGLKEQSNLSNMPMLNEAFSLLCSLSKFNMTFVLKYSTLNNFVFKKLESICLPITLFDIIKNMVQENTNWVRTVLNSESLVRFYKAGVVPTYINEVKNNKGYVSDVLSVLATIVSKYKKENSKLDKLLKKGIKKISKKSSTTPAHPPAHPPAPVAGGAATTNATNNATTNTDTTSLPQEADNPLPASKQQEETKNSSNKSSQQNSLQPVPHLSVEEQTQQIGRILGINNSKIDAKILKPPTPLTPYQLQMILAPLITAVASLPVMKNSDPTQHIVHLRQLSSELLNKLSNLPDKSVQHLTAIANGTSSDLNNDHITEAIGASAYKVYMDDVRQKINSLIIDLKNNLKPSNFKVEYEPSEEQPIAFDNLPDGQLFMAPSIITPAYEELVQVRAYGPYDIDDYNIKHPFAIRSLGGGLLKSNKTLGNVTPSIKYLQGRVLPLCDVKPSQNLPQYLSSRDPELALLNTGPYKSVILSMVVPSYSSLLYKSKGITDVSVQEYMCIIADSNSTFILSSEQEIPCTPSRIGITIMPKPNIESVWLTSLPPIVTSFAPPLGIPVSPNMPVTDWQNISMETATGQKIFWLQETGLLGRIKIDSIKQEPFSVLSALQDKANVDKSVTVDSKSELVISDTYRKFQYEQYQGLGTLKDWCKLLEIVFEQNRQEKLALSNKQQTQETIEPSTDQQIENQEQIEIQKSKLRHPVYSYLYCPSDVISGCYSASVAFHLDSNIRKKFSTIEYLLPLKCSSSSGNLPIPKEITIGNKKIDELPPLNVSVIDGIKGVWSRESNEDVQSLLQGKTLLFTGLKLKNSEFLSSSEFEPYLINHTHNLAKQFTNADKNKLKFPSELTIYGTYLFTQRDSLIKNLSNPTADLLSSNELTLDLKGLFSNKNLEYWLPRTEINFTSVVSEGNAIRTHPNTEQTHSAGNPEIRITIISATHSLSGQTIAITCGFSIYNEEHYPKDMYISIWSFCVDAKTFTVFPNSLSYERPSLNNWFYPIVVPGFSPESFDILVYQNNRGTTTTTTTTTINARVISRWDNKRISKILNSDELKNNLDGTLLPSQTSYDHNEETFNIEIKATAYGQIIVFYNRSRTESDIDPTILYRHHTDEKFSHFANIQEQIFHIIAKEDDEFRKTTGVLYRRIKIMPCGGNKFLLAVSVVIDIQINAREHQEERKTLFFRWELDGSDEQKIEEINATEQGLNDWFPIIQWSGVEGVFICEKNIDINGPQPRFTYAVYPAPAVYNSTVAPFTEPLSLTSSDVIYCSVAQGWGMGSAVRQEIIRPAFKWSEGGTVSERMLSSSLAIFLQALYSLWFDPLGSSASKITSSSRVSSSPNFTPLIKDLNIYAWGAMNQVSKLVNKRNVPLISAVQSIKRMIQRNMIGTANNQTPEAEANIKNLESIYNENEAGTLFGLWEILLKQSSYPFFKLRKNGIPDSASCLLFSGPHSIVSSYINVMIAIQKEVYFAPGEKDEFYAMLQSEQAKSWRPVQYQKFLDSYLPFLAYEKERHQFLHNFIWPSKRLSASSSDLVIPLRENFMRVLYYGSSAQIKIASRIKPNSWQPVESVVDNVTKQKGGKKKSEKIIKSLNPSLTWKSLTEKEKKMVKEEYNKSNAKMNNISFSQWWNILCEG